MAIIPLKKSFVKEVFLDNYETPNFESQSNFNNYFRGIVIDAKEKTHASGQRGGALISFNLNSTGVGATSSLIEVYYTNTFFKSNSTEIDTVITNTHAFKLGGIEYGLIPDFDDMSLGEYIDLDTYMGDWENMQIAMNVLYLSLIHI